MLVCVAIGFTCNATLADDAQAAGKKSYKIIYKLNDGKQAKYQVQRVAKGKTLRVSKLKKPYRKGYNFRGWYSNKSLTKKAKTVKGVAKKSKRTLYAKWTLKKYSITYKLNKGRLTGSYPTTYKYGKGVVLPTPKRKGCTFVGWYKDKTFTKRVTSISKKATGAKTFYAKWTSTKYTINYHLNGGEITGSYAKGYRMKTGATLPVPYREGYVFLGWYTNKALTKPIDNIEVGMTGNKNLYARWEKRIIIAHRGFHVDMPENTVAAFRAAKEAGFEYFECDVRFTRDGVPVLVHDETVELHSLDEEGQEYAFSATIDSTDFEAIDDARLQGVPFGLEEADIATFEEMIQLCAECDLRPFIHVKAGTKKQIQGLVDVVDSYGMPSKVSWCLSDGTCQGYVLAKHPNARIVCTYTSLSKSRIKAAAELAEQGAHVYIAGKYNYLSDSLVQYCRDLRVPLGVWTLCDDSQIPDTYPYVCMYYLDGLVPEDIPEEEPSDTEDEWTGDTEALMDVEPEMEIQSDDPEVEEF